MTIYEVLSSVSGISAYYGTASGDVALPFIVYMGDGQDTFSSDNIIYWKKEKYRAEYYFKVKSETNESAIETALNNNGFFYEKSEDTWMQDQEIFVIYYYIN